MHVRTFYLAYAIATLGLGSCDFQQAGAPVKSAAPAITSAFAIPAEVASGYPPQFDLVEEADGYTYRMGNTEAPLYLSSAPCEGACVKDYLPALADADGRPIGGWTIIVQGNGDRQWAFKGKAVYVFAQDHANKPTGASAAFEVMPHFR